MSRRLRHVTRTHTAGGKNWITISTTDGDIPTMLKRVSEKFQAIFKKNLLDYDFSDETMVDQGDGAHAI